MVAAYEIFQENELKDSPFILTYRELWGRVRSGEPARSQDVRQLQHMVCWLEAKVAEYECPLPYADQFQALYDATQHGWSRQLEGVYCLVDFLEGQGADLLDTGLACCEEGESVLRQLQEAILAEREDDCLCSGYLS